MMLLRRINQHVKDQNWFAVFVDFLIVVVGILIAMQITNWNQERQNQQLGDYYLKRLIIDLEEDLTLNNRVTQYYQVVFKNTEKADRLLSNSDSDAKELLIALYRASEYSDEPTNDATWRQILSSGHLGLLPDIVVEGKLVDYYKYSSYLNSDSILESPYRAAIRSIIPVPLQLQLRSTCSDIFDQHGNVLKLRNDCNLDISVTELEQLIKSIRLSSSIREHLRSHFSRVGVVLHNRETTTPTIEQLLDILKKQE